MVHLFFFLFYMKKLRPGGVQELPQWKSVVPRFTMSISTQKVALKMPPKLPSSASGQISPTAYISHLTSADMRLTS